MGRMGKFTVKGLDELHKKLTEMGKSSDEFMEKCVIELALRLYSKVVKRTPVGDYDIYMWKSLQSGIPRTTRRAIST